MSASSIQELPPTWYRLTFQRDRPKPYCLGLFGQGARRDAPGAPAHARVRRAYNRAYTIEGVQNISLRMAWIAHDDNATTPNYTRYQLGLDLDLAEREEREQGLAQTG